MEVTGKELWLIEREAKAACYREMRESRIEGREFSERTDGFIKGLCRAAEIMGQNGWEVYCEAKDDAHRLLGDEHLGYRRWRERKPESPKQEEPEPASQPAEPEEQGINPLKVFALSFGMSLTFGLIAAAVAVGVFGL